MAIGRKQSKLSEVFETFLNGEYANPVLVIDELGYRPNVAAQTMRSEVSRTVACVIRDNSVAGFAQFVRAADDFADEPEFEGRREAELEAEAEAEHDEDDRAEAAEAARWTGLALQGFERTGGPVSPFHDLGRRCVLPLPAESAWNKPSFSPEAAAGDLARKVSKRPAWIRGIDHRIEPHYPGASWDYYIGMVGNLTNHAGKAEIVGKAQSGDELVQVYQAVDAACGRLIQMYRSS